MSTNDSLKALIELGFTGLEAEIYTFLLQESPATGYRIAQAIGKPVANTYKGVQSLEKKGAILVEESANRICRAVPPDELLARLERRFQEKKRKANLMLSGFKKLEGDDRVYQIRSAEQVIERCRRMLQNCRKVAVIDIFPKMLDQLRADIEELANRDVSVAVKVYRPAQIAGAKVFEQADGEKVLRRWSGQWLNVVVDGAEYLLAFLTPDAEQVYQAVWSGSAYLSWVYYCAVMAELQIVGLKKRISKDMSAQQIQQLLEKYDSMFSLEAPGYQQLISRFGSR
ncbi:hypothetical protein MJD09_10525 [bacterium]|nr:hypothetical protein [bacterium]